MVIKMGNLVKFHYIGKFGNGEIFASTQNTGPIECKVGEGKVVKDIEDALVGMEISEKKEIVIPPNRYGKWDEALVKKFPKDKLQGNIDLEIGKMIKLEDRESQSFNAKVLAVETDTVTFDLNHPLAGKSLRFDIEVEEIQ